MNNLLVPDNIDFKEYEKNTESSVRVRGLDRWSDDLERLIQRGNEIIGDKLPWSKTHDQIRFRGGEVTVWAGINGHGKSLCSGMVAMGFATQDRRVCIASLEMAPERTLLRMLRQASMTNTPTIDIKNRFIDWMNGKLYIYDHIGRMDVDNLFGAIKWTAENLGIKHFFIDNLGLCLRKSDDYNEQKDFVVRCMTAAKQLNIHIHIIHHIRKMEDEFKVPGKFDVRGGAEIIDYVDQAIIVYRNKKKERDVASYRFKGQDIPEDVLNASDAVLNVAKNREDFEGRIHLWFDPASLQYVGDSHKTLINLMGKYSFSN